MTPEDLPERIAEALYDEENTYIYYVKGRPTRACKECRRHLVRERRARRRAS